MSVRRRVAGPLAAGLLAATAAFTVVAIATRSETPDAEIAGPGAARSSSQAPLTRDPEPAAISRHDEGRAVFARVGCGSCHRLAAAGSDGEIGPDLDERLASHTSASLTAKVLDPSQGLGEGFGVMPLDFGSRMTGGELDALVDFLLAARRSH